MTHPYIPNTDEDVRRMLDAIGVAAIDDLFAPVPAGVRLRGNLKIPAAMSEPDLMKLLQDLACENADCGRAALFLGGGVYRHYAPSFIDQMLLRSEFYTAYTPYQPEIAQGTLQAIFEFQTMVCQLTGMDLANASMYDGSTAMTEAALMAARLTHRDRVVVARNVHPQYRQVLATYTRNLGVTIVEVGYAPDGRVDARALAEAAGGAAAVIFQYPNYFGLIEDPRCESGRVGTSQPDHGGGNGGAHGRPNRTGADRDLARERSGRQTPDARCRRGTRQAHAVLLQRALCGDAG